MHEPTLRLVFDVAEDDPVGASEFMCGGCGMSLPDDIVVASGGLGVIEAGGALLPADSTTMGVPCTHPGVAAQRKLSDECLSTAQRVTTRYKEDRVGHQLDLRPDPRQFDQYEPESELDPVRAQALGLTAGCISSF